MPDDTVRLVARRLWVSRRFLRWSSYCIDIAAGVSMKPGGAKPIAFLMLDRRRLAQPLSTVWRSRALFSSTCGSESRPGLRPRRTRSLKKSAISPFSFMAAGRFAGHSRSISCPASRFLIGAVLAYFVELDAVNTAYLLPFAAGNFLYIGATDLVPEINKLGDLARQSTAPRDVHRGGSDSCISRPSRSETGRMR